MSHELVLAGDTTASLPALIGRTDAGRNVDLRKGVVLRRAIIVGVLFVPGYFVPRLFRRQTVGRLSDREQSDTDSRRYLEEALNRGTPNV
jgi:hypothetical protein